jgi:hypothetical protein
MIEKRAVMRKQSGTSQEDPEELVDPETIQSAPMDQAVPTQTPQTITQPEAQQTVQLEDEEIGGILP